MWGERTQRVRSKAFADRSLIGFNFLRNATGSQLQCAFANSSGAVASVITWVILDRTGHFFGAFAVAAAVSCAGALAGYSSLARLSRDIGHGRLRLIWGNSGGTGVSQKDGQSGELSDANNLL